MKTLQLYDENFFTVIAEPISRDYALAKFSQNIQADKPTIANALTCLWRRDPDTNEIVCQWAAV